MNLILANTTLGALKPYLLLYFLVQYKHLVENFLEAQLCCSQFYLIFKFSCLKDFLLFENLNFKFSYLKLYFLVSNKTIEC